MALTPEQNRAKMAKYRTRKKLRELDVDEDTIEQIVAGTDWLNTTPAMILEQFLPDDMSYVPRRSVTSAGTETTIEQTEDTNGWMLAAAVGLILAALGAPFIAAIIFKFGK